MLHALPPDAYLDLELKEETLSPEDADRIALILDSHRSRERLMISSFDPRLLFPFRRMEFTVGLLVGEEAAGRGLVGLASDLLRLRPHYVNLPVDMLRMFGVPRSVLICRILHTFGFSLLFWTVNDPEDAASVAPLARILVTDEVELIRKTTDS